MKRSRETSDESFEKRRNEFQKNDVDKFLNACREGDVECVQSCLSLGKVNVVRKIQFQAFTLTQIFNKIDIYTTHMYI